MIIAIVKLSREDCKSNLNPFQVDYPFLYPLNSSENLCFDIFRGCGKQTLVSKGFISAEGLLFAMATFTACFTNIPDVFGH